ncbi:MAG: hypothetical protein HY321_22630 [Armatimonadetes bacterium]|nr:hypothetical protein [Armatimonadota bacterium]
MSRMVRAVSIVLAFLAAGLCLVRPAHANGGPFVVKYPGGDPSAKGVLARLGDDLKPRRETRLRVLREDLSISFARDRMALAIGSAASAAVPPLALVSAAYTIENPTAEEIEVDFGFPILRGVYVSPFEMLPKPDVSVRLNQQPVKCTLISNSVIYGVIRQRARETLNRAIEDDQVLAPLVHAVGRTEGAQRETARRALSEHLTGPRQWNARDTALLVEYASLDLGKAAAAAPDRGPFWMLEGKEIAQANIGPLGAIGEQKATQLLAYLASRFDPKVASTYEGIFAAWGGDVRERSVDFATGEVRPREVTLDPGSPGGLSWGASLADPTIYARVDYLDPNAKISSAEKASCQNILKNLPVVFTFAPMNLLHYRVMFPPHDTQTLTVAYQQYAYVDTRAPSSFQLAYVVHPASLWDFFGPICLQVAVPDGVRFRASVPTQPGGVAERPVRAPSGGAAYLTEAPRTQGPEPKEPTARYRTYTGVLADKTGELLLGLDADAWLKAGGEIAKPHQKVVRPAQKAVRQ